MKRASAWLLFGAFIILLSVGQSIAFYTDWLWFQEVGYTGVFTTIIGVKLLLALLSGGLFFLFLYFNVKFAARTPPRGIRFFDYENVLELPSPELIDPFVRRLLMPACIVLALILGPQGAGEWEDALLFFNAGPFSLNDPVFEKDIGFFVFRLPFLMAVYHWFIVLVAITLVATAAVYVLYRGIQYGPRGLSFNTRAKSHLLALAAAFLLAKAAGYYLDGFQLLYSPSGAAFGAGYTALHATLPVLRLLAVLSVIGAGVLLFQIWRPGIRYVALTAGALVLIHVVGLGIYPVFLQRFRVGPNEISAERPFIERTIQFTRRAYGLDKLEVQEFAADERLTAADLKRNDATLKNIRLWEHRPLLATYGQLQEIRTYYKFVDVDNDRYPIEGVPRQVMLSVRELSHPHLNNAGWINEHLTYTHGYGAVFGPVNQVTPEGLPEFFIKDIPPVATIDALKIARPEIYYGELANDYVFVKTRARELDYPAG
ncbi:MAG TPA: UPF0182 family protein, partial [Candidatus Binatia bacterium]